MRDTLRSALRNMGHNLELYATFVVCAFLLILKVLHVVEEHWISSAILVTLMLLALGSLRDRAGDIALRYTLDRIASKSNNDSTVRWYTRRTEATADMLADMDRFRHIVFMGISHRQLPGYLRDRLQDASTPLPWESVEVYFASCLMGEAYEGSDFHRHLMNTRQEVAALLTDPTYAARLPHLSSISFFQQSGFSTHTGSMFGAGPSELAVIYAVHSAVHLHGDTHQGLTIRLSAGPGLGFRDGRFDHYEGAYRTLSQSSVRLGVFRRSVWDSSAERWSDYARQSGVLAHSAAVVADMMSPNNGDSVLDIGSGSGDTANVILERHRSVSVVLLDGSPQMVRLLRDRFHQQARVRFALCQLPPLDGASVDLHEDKFTFIVMHQSLGELIRAFVSLDELARWCRGRLRANGQLLVTAHNTLAVTDPPNGFARWNDPFRAELVKRLKRARYKPRPGDAQHLIGQEQIRATFESHGFKLTEQRQEVIELNYEERRRLWHVPAVMDSMIDTRELEQVGVDRLVDEIVASLRGQKTMPRTVVFWRFTLAGEVQQTSNAMQEQTG